jgi:hypothetical protein
MILLQKTIKYLILLNSIIMKSIIIKSNFLFQSNVFTNASAISNLQLHESLNNRNINTNTVYQNVYNFFDDNEH